MHMRVADEYTLSLTSSPLYVSNESKSQDEEHGSKHTGHCHNNVFLSRSYWSGWRHCHGSSGCRCAACGCIKVWYCHSTLTWLHRVPPSINGNCLVCTLSMQPMVTFQCCRISCGTSWKKVGPEGDIAPSSTGEVAIVQTDVLEIWISTLAVLSDSPVHLILYCTRNVSWLCLYKQ